MYYLYRKPCIQGLIEPNLKLFVLKYLDVVIYEEVFVIPTTVGSNVNIFVSSIVFFNFYLKFNLIYHCGIGVYLSYAPLCLYNTKINRTYLK